MFGSEIVFLSLGDDKPVTFESLIDKFFDAMDSGISDANHFTVSLICILNFIIIHIFQQVKFNNKLSLLSIFSMKFVIT